MLDLNEIVVFARVVQAGSFTGAARALDLPKSTVSRKVTALEERLGARLLQRTTRKLSLTEAGRAYYEHSARVVGEVEEAERAVGNLQDAPRGLLRLTTPLNFDFVAPVATEFLARHPDVQLEIVCTDRVAGLVEEGFDLAIRAGRLADSTLIGRRLASLRSYLVASPAYLGERGRPRSPDDLVRHSCLLFSGGSVRGAWRLLREGRKIEVALRARLVVNDFDLLYEAAVAGLGIAMVPEHRCLNDLRRGRLERVLPRWSSPETALHAVYPSTRHLSPAMKAFLDHLQARLLTVPAR